MQKNSTNMKIVTLLTCLMFASIANADGLPEKHYQQQWCEEHKGVMEYRVPGGRVDCLTETHAVEVDFARKWAEAMVSNQQRGVCH